MTDSSTAVVMVTNPFVGPRPIDTGQKIFGRDREIEDLYYLLSAQRIVLLHSPSGAGKSSLIQAGLMPRLAQLFDVWGPTRVNLQPPEGDAAGVNRYVRSANLGFEARIPKERQRPSELISAMTLSEYVAGRPRRRSASPNIVLLFDQFEEILTVDPLALEAKHEFFDQLGKLLQDPHIWALFALREDYLAPLDPYAEQVPSHLKNRFRLDLLGREAAREAISRSVEEGGRRFAPEAVGKLVNDLATVQVQRPDGTFESQTGPYVEPLHLQVACRGLWERMPADRLTIDLDDIQSFGDVTKALAEYYEKEVAGIGDAGVERAIREWVGEKLITPDGIRGQVLKSAGQSEGLNNELIGRLVDTHLVRGEQRAGATWYELSHDRLIEPVRANNARWFEANLSAVQREAALWDKQSRPNGLLLRGPVLVGAERWASEHASELTLVESDFLQACREARIQTKRMQRLRVSLVAFTVAALVAAGVAMFFVRKANKAKAQAENAVVVANGVILPIVAVRDITHVPKRSLLMAVEYTSLLRERGEPDAAWTSSVAFNALFHGLPDGKSMGWPTVVASTTALSRDGHKVAAAINGSIEIRDVANPNAQAIVLPGQSNSAITAMSFSDDARWLASGAEDNWVYLWDLHNLQAKPARLPGHTKYSNTLAFTPDGHWLAIASNDETKRTGVIQMWDLTVTPPSKGPATGTSALHPSIDPLVKSDAWIQAVAFSPDGHQLANAIGIFTYLCDLPPAISTATRICAGQIVRINQTCPRRIAAMTFSPDGRWLAFGGGLTVVLHDRKSNKPRTITGPTGNVMALAFSQDSAWLAIGGKDQTAQLVNLTMKEPSFSAVLNGHESPVSSLAFYRHADTQELISASENDGVMRWTIPSRPLEPVTLNTAGHKPWVLAFSHNGTWLATGGTEGGVRLWNLAKSMSDNIPLQQAGPGITAMEFSPDRRDHTASPPPRTKYQQPTNRADRGRPRLLRRARLPKHPRSGPNNGKRSSGRESAFPDRQSRLRPQCRRLDAGFESATHA